MSTAIFSNRQNPYLTGKGEEIRTSIAAPLSIPSGIGQVPHALIWALAPVDTMRDVSVTADDINFTRKGLYFVSAMIQSQKIAGPDGMVVGAYMVKYPQAPAVSYSISENLLKFDPTGSSGDLQEQFISAVVYMNPGEILQVQVFNAKDDTSIDINLPTYLHIVKIA